MDGGTAPTEPPAPVSYAHALTNSVVMDSTLWLWPPTNPKLCILFLSTKGNRGANQPTNLVVDEAKVLGVKVSLRELASLCEKFHAWRVVLFLGKGHGYRKL